MHLVINNVASPPPDVLFTYSWMLDASFLGCKVFTQGIPEGHEHHFWGVLTFLFPLWTTKAVHYLDILYWCGWAWNIVWKKNSFVYGYGKIWWKITKEGHFPKSLCFNYFLKAPSDQRNRSTAFGRPSIWTAFVVHLRSCLDYCFVTSEDLTLRGGPQKILFRGVYAMYYGAFKPRYYLLNYKF